VAYVDPQKNRAAARRWNAQHRDLKNARARAYYQANRKAICEKERLYREAHREDIAKKRRARYVLTIEDQRTRSRERYQADLQLRPGFHLEQGRRWRAANRDKHRAEGKRFRERTRAAVLHAYGGVCVCCGETEVKFLGIDHIEGGGTTHRKELGGVGKLYAWLLKQGCPDGYRLLCHNCNLARGFYGACPHESVSPAFLRVCAG